MSNVRRHRKHPSQLMHLSFVAVANTSLGSAGGGSVLIASQAASCSRSRRTRVPGRVVNASLGSVVVGSVLITSQAAASSRSGHGGKLVALYQRQEAQPMRARPNSQAVQAPATPAPVVLVRFGYKQRVCEHRCQGAVERLCEATRRTSRSSGQPSAAAQLQRYAPCQARSGAK
jgi:hypothetical protein